MKRHLMIALLAVTPTAAPAAVTFHLEGVQGGASGDPATTPPTVFVPFVLDITFNSAANLVSQGQNFASWEADSFTFRLGDASTSSAEAGGVATYSLGIGESVTSSGVSYQDYVSLGVTSSIGSGGLSFFFGDSVTLPLAISAEPAMYRLPPVVGVFGPYDIGEISYSSRFFTLTNATVDGETEYYAGGGELYGLEPASWALMLAGFSMVGATMRTRKSAVSFG